MGWALLHQLTGKTVSTDMPMGQSDLGNPSMETPFSGDSRMCQIDTLSKLGQKGRQNNSDGLHLSLRDEQLWTPLFLQPSMGLRSGS